MSQQFKPGDVVQHRETKSIKATVFEVHADGERWRTQSSEWVLCRNYELAERMIPISKLREVCLRRLCNANWPAHKLLIRSLFNELTGENL